MTIELSNASYMYDCSEYYSERILRCLDEIQFTIPEYTVLQWMGNCVFSEFETDLVQFIAKWDNEVYRKLTHNEITIAISRLLSKGHLVKIDEFHLETIHRLLDMCKIENRGFLPLLGHIEVTPRGFSVYQYFQTTILEQNYIHNQDGVYIIEDDYLPRDEWLFKRVCMPNREELINYLKSANNGLGQYHFNIDNIYYCEISGVKNGGRYYPKDIHVT
jgi:hypothetical protein